MVLCRSSASALIWWLLFLFAVADGAMTTGDAAAEELSGAIHYTGSMHVSSTIPIIMNLLLPPLPGAVKVRGIDQAVISTSPASFVLHTPEVGQYYLVYSLDIRNYGDGSVSVGAPFQFYDHRFVPLGDPISVPQAGLSLEFDDSQLIPGIAGTVTYTGNRSGGCVIVQAFENHQPEGTPDSFGCAENDGRYERPFLNTGQPYYLQAFMDANDNRQLDPGEPFGTCSNPVVAGPDQTGVAITFDGDGTATCSVLSPPTPTPTVIPAPCVGDCNSDHSVTVDELLTMVNIALGNADATACTAGDASHDSEITIDEILRAVNNALDGCAGVNITGTWDCTNQTLGTTAVQTLVQNGSTVTGTGVSSDGSTFSLTGSISGFSLSMTGFLSDGFSWTSIATVSADGNSMDGNWTGSDGSSGTASCLKRVVSARPF